MFHSATLRLTALYVLILALICLFFSLNLYRVSTRELDTGLGRQMMLLQQAPRLENLVGDDFIQLRQTELSDARQRIIFGLVNVDLVILLLGGVGSYFLAKRTLRPIQDAHDAQVRFTADASHELRTPLSAMRAEIEVALRDKKLTTQDARKLLASNLEELAKITALSEGLLKLAQDTNLAEIKKVSIRSIIAEAIRRVADTAAKNNITIDNSVTNDFIKADESSLVQVVTILLDNAIKYSQAGQVVRIDGEIKNKQFLLSVQDHGVGISQQDLPHIFDRFYRADASRSKEKVAGYGLGLSIAKKIIEAHGGTIAASSVAGKGSTFVVRLEYL